jgi:ABC-type transporter Mla maintaining outer membrane lipid asymmetry ATPase subunit MlaF
MPHVMDAAIEIEGLRVVRGRRLVLDGVSLRVAGKSVTGRWVPAGAASRGG